jgi:signal transduction histidine kinase
MSNPRFGVDATINSVLKRLCGFYRADLTLLILDDAIAASHYFQCGDDGEQPTTPRTRWNVNGVSRLLGTLSPQYAVAYTDRALKYGFQSGGYYAYDVAEQRTVSQEWSECEKLAAACDAGSFIIVPLRSRQEVVGRILISAHRSRAFKAADVHFLLHVADHLMPVLNHIKLVDRLTLAASEEERKRIARDIHDGIIQPYIGLQMGLVGVRHKLSQHGISEAREDIEQLIEITDKSIEDLRRYVRGLKEVGEPNWNLLPAIRRFAAKFSEVSEIKVEVVCESESCVNDRLAAEAFQIVVEGLSNIRRHTPADQAAIKLRCEDDALVLQIENGPTGQNGFKPFTPHSITERTTALGGHVEVKRREDGGTIVRAEIPL